MTASKTDEAAAVESEGGNKAPVGTVSIQTVAQGHLATVFARILTRERQKRVH